jgi:uncharacterized protein
MKYVSVLGLVAVLVQAASGSIVISEWMYSGTDGEFVEFTNVGTNPVDMTNWSYSDTDSEPGDVAFLDVFGLVQPGESVILTEAEPSLFRSAWGLDAAIKIFGPNTDSNLGRNDQINLYDAGGNLVDQLAYGDQTYPGTPRTQNRSCNIPATDYDFTVAQTTWVLAGDGDEYGSWPSSGFDVGSPGRIPEPTALTLLVLGGLALARQRG